MTSFKPEMWAAYVKNIVKCIVIQPVEYDLVSEDIDLSLFSTLDSGFWMMCFLVFDSGFQIKCFLVSQTKHLCFS